MKNQTNNKYKLESGCNNDENNTKRSNIPIPKRHSRDVFHAWMLEGVHYAGSLDMPILKKVQHFPRELISFSDAMNKNCTDFDKTVHFFEDDNRIERFWNNPHAYIEKLSKFDSVIGLDYSVCWDFPEPVKSYNYFRNSVCTYWLQNKLTIAIPQVRCENYNYKNVLAGFPKNSTLAIGARSMVKDKRDRKVLKESIKHIVDYLEPLNIIWYGSNKYRVADYIIYKGIPIQFFEGKSKGMTTSKKYLEVNCGRTS